LHAGQFDAASGFEHWIPKFGGVAKDRELGSPQGYSRIEFAYSLMAVAAGIEMSEVAVDHGRSIVKQALRESAER
jgi:serine/threonine-protein kinase HipA